MTAEVPGSREAADLSSETTEKIQAKADQYMADIMQRIEQEKKEGKEITEEELKTIFISFCREITDKVNLILVNSVAEFDYPWMKLVSVEKNAGADFDSVALARAIQEVRLQFSPVYKIGENNQKARNFENGYFNNWLHNGGPVPYRWDLARLEKIKKTLDNTLSLSLEDEFREKVKKRLKELELELVSILLNKVETCDDSEDMLKQILKGLNLKRDVAFSEIPTFDVLYYISVKDEEKLKIIKNYINSVRNIVVKGQTEADNISLTQAFNSAEARISASDVEFENVKPFYFYYLRMNDQDDLLNLVDALVQEKNKLENKLEEESSE